MYLYMLYHMLVGPSFGLVFAPRDVFTLEMSILRGKQSVRAVLCRAVPCASHFSHRSHVSVDISNPREKHVPTAVAVNQNLYI